MAAELSNAAVSGVASKVTEFWFDSIKREISYVFKYQSYVRYIKNQVEELGYKRQRVEQDVKQAERQGDKIHEDVRKWMISVDDFTANLVKHIMEDEGEAKKPCFRGLCPNLFKRYNLSKKAIKAAKAGADLLGRGNFSTVSYHPAPDLERQLKELEFVRQRVEKDVEHAERQGEEIFDDVKDWLIQVKDFDDKAVKAAEEVDNLLRKGIFSNVSYRPIPDRTKLMHVRGYQQFDSRMKVFQEVMEALKDNKFNIIGVYGMGGVGKTTLVKQVLKQVMEDKLFDRLVMAEVTQTPDHMAIQAKIAFDLGLKFDMDESVFERADRLRERLKKDKRVLVVLDNIWTNLELDAIGIPSENDEKERRCTIILTSRRQDLLSNHMNSQKNFLIEVLSKNEAWQLFEKIVGDSSKQYDFQPTADEIVGICGGLPVALSTVANALKNKSLAIWKDALNQLRSSNRREIPGMDANVYSSIELSYSFLESDETKSLFLLCGLFSEGHPIKVPSLLRYGVGLGLFKNVHTLEAGRNRVDTLIDSLKTSCLLLDGDVQDEVKMHDIIHVIAVSIAAEKLMFNIPNVAELKEEIEKIIHQKGPTTISLPYRDFYELPEQLECPQLKLFLLFTKGDSSRSIPDLFFKGMKELKVLHLAGIDCLPSLPSSIGCLINLQTLCLDGCQLKDVAIVGQLKQLEILSCQSSTIKQLPEEIGQLTRLRLLDLSNSWSLEVIMPNVISKLSRLEELYLGNSFTQWEKVEGGRNASLVELKGLSKLATLDIHIPDAEIIPQDLVSVELERYRIFIGNMWGWYDKYETSRLMALGGLEKSILLENYMMKMLLKRTKDLYLEELKGFRNVVHELDDGKGFPLLKHLRVEKCYEILHIVSSVGRVHCKVFPLLESLFISDMDNFQEVWQGQVIDNQSFSNLRILKVERCVRLKHLFSFSMAKNLLRLWKVEVSDCKNLKMIVVPDMEKPATILGFKEIIGEHGDPVKVIFPSLEELKLDSLIAIENIFILPNLFQGMSCPNLTKLTVCNCHRLKYLFSYSMINSLVRLQHLKISYCESMEGVVVDTTSTGKLIEIVFPKLHYLEFFRLPKLTSFAVGIHSIEFTSLLEVKIVNCRNLRRFISINSSEDSTQPLFDEKVQLPNLEVLTLGWMDNLRQIWHHQLASDSLRKLKKLRISSCHKLISVFPPMVILPSLEELNLNSTITVENIWPNQFQGMSSCPNLKKLTVWSCHRLQYLLSYSMVNSLVRLQHLKITSCHSMEVVVVDTNSRELGRDEGKLIEMVFPKLRSLRLVGLQKLKSFAMGIHSVEFPSLLEVAISCPNLRRFISMSSSENKVEPLFDEKVIFPNLEELTLYSLMNIENIWLNHFQRMASCPNLTKLTVWNCHRLKYLFSYSMINSLVRLQHLEISYCESMEVIVVDTTSTGSGREQGKLIEMVFPKLQYLELFRLPKLASFVVGIHSFEFPSLIEVKIVNCRNLRRFVSTSTYEDNTQPLFNEKVALPSLMTLDISWCDGLRSLMTLSIAESMVNITTMEITCCEKIEEIIEVKDDRVVFNQLKYLTLGTLPSLKCFCLGKYTLEFSSLERVRVSKCPNMKTFSQGLMLTPKLHQVKVKDYDPYDEQVCWEGNLNSTIQKMFKEMVGFRYIEDVKLSQFEHLKEIWHNQALPVSFFKDLENLMVDDCTNMSIAISMNLLRLLNNLLSLIVQNCDSVEEVFHLEELNIGEHFGPLFPRLKELKLINLPKLQRFCNFKGVIINMPFLSKMLIENCPNMEAFISNPTSLHMAANKEPQEMTSEENFLQLADTQHFFDEKVWLPWLRELKLSRLPKLLHLWKENSQPSQVFQLLKTLKISECNKLEKLLPSSATYKNLMTLEVSKCDSLINIGTLSTAEGLVKLKRMKITDCKMIEEIIQQVGEEVKKDCIVFRQLEYLGLDGLPSLKSFCLGNCTLEFPSLERVVMRECLKMKTFSQGVLHAPMLHKVQLEEEEEEEGDDNEECWEGNLNSTIQQLIE